MALQKTAPTNSSVTSYIAGIDEETRRQDCAALAELMAKTTAEPAKMWGSSIVGFGSYHYLYESSRQGEMCLVGFSSRKAAITIYGLGLGKQGEEMLSRLGECKMGKGCLYVRQLSDIDLGALQQLIKDAMTTERPGQIVSPPQAPTKPK